VVFAVPAGAVKIEDLKHHVHVSSRVVLKSSRIERGGHGVESVPAAIGDDESASSASDSDSDGGQGDGNSGSDDSDGEGGGVDAGGVGPGAGSKTLSWIWTAGVQDFDTGDAAFQDSASASPLGSLTNCAPALSVEWSKSHARADRHVEEVVLTTEEMCRNFEYGRFAHSAWLQLAASSTEGADARKLEGRRAYALEHARYEQDLEARLIKMWSPVLAATRAVPLFAGRLVDATAAVLNAPTAPPASASLAARDASALVISFSEALRLSDCKSSREF
jgi:hypothetical protein